MAGGLGVGLVTVVAVLAPTAAARGADFQQRTPRQLVVDLAAPDATVRARAACELKEHGDAAADALQPLVKLLADGAPVDPSICSHWWRRGNADNLTTPGQLAATALVTIGSRAFDPLLTTLGHSVWIARRNAAWALGALDDPRAGPALIAALRDAEPAVREQAAWALGALDDRAAIGALVTALDDTDARVRRQAAWALGAIGDAVAIEGLLRALKDHNSGVRQQAAWALGAIGR